MDGVCTLFVLGVISYSSSSSNAVPNPIDNININLNLAKGNDERKYYGSAIKASNHVERSEIGNINGNGNDVSENGYRYQNGWTQKLKGTHRCNRYSYNRNIYNRLGSYYQRRAKYMESGNFTQSEDSNTNGNGPASYYIRRSEDGNTKGNGNEGSDNDYRYDGYKWTEKLTKKCKGYRYRYGYSYRYRYRYSKVMEAKSGNLLELSATDILKQLNILHAFMLSNLKPTEKQDCMKELKVSIKKYQEIECVIANLRYKKPFVRTKEITKRLWRDSRLFTTLKDTIICSGCTSLKRGKSLIEYFSKSFQTSAEKGGGLRMYGQGDVTCNLLDDQYRRIDGKCNNVANKHQGSAGIALKRFLQNDYYDGISMPRGGFPSSHLPSARVVSVKIHQSTNPNPVSSKGYSHMVMQFGQFLAYDISVTAAPELDCCKGTILDENPDICFNIDITGDVFYSGKTTCHTFSRSETIVTDGEAREQMNGITAFIDASNVYGSVDYVVKSLRTLTDGKLKVHTDGPMLPTRKQCSLKIRPIAQLNDDLVGGDVRAILTPTLASINSLFLNEHNRIVNELKFNLASFLSGKSSHEQDEIIFQESRKIVIAEMQNIVYNEFLPIVLGKTQFKKHNLELSTLSQYDDKVDPSIRNEFATVAFRFGHSLIAGIFNGNGGWNLRNNFLSEEPIFVSGIPPNNNGRAWHSELEEASKQRCPADDLVCTEDVTNFLFSNTRGSSSDFGEDLIARNIQRGRDHGIPSYNELRAFCGLRPLTNFHFKPDEIITENWAKIRNVYGTGRVNDIDAFTGGLAETAPPDGLVGPTFACIIGKQFNSLKFGDRYFFNNELGKNDNARGLKVNSRNTVRQRTLGDILCDNTNIAKLQKFVMKEEDEDTNPQQDCKSRNALDLEAVASDITSNGAGVGAGARLGMGNVFRSILGAAGVGAGIGAGVIGAGVGAGVGAEVGAGIASNLETGSD